MKKIRASFLAISSIVTAIGMITQLSAFALVSKVAPVPEDACSGTINCKNDTLCAQYGRFGCPFCDYHTPGSPVGQCGT